VNYKAIAGFSAEIAKYNPANIEMDISVFNGAVNLTIDEWHKVGHKRVFSAHLLCESHAEACIIAATLTAFIHRRF